MSGPVILLVDNDSITESFLKRTFASRGIRLISVKTEGEAVNVMDPVAVILCSTQLNGKDGYQLASRLGDYHPSAALFLLYQEAVKYDVQLGRLVGAIGAFSKPLHESSLVPRLEEFLQAKKEHPLSERKETVGFTNPPTAHLINIAPNESQSDSIEQHVQELLPLMVERVLKLQLEHNPEFRGMIERVVREAVEKIVIEKLKSQ